MSDITTVNPATGEEIATYSKLSREEACAAVDKCHAAFEQMLI